MTIANRESRIGNLNQGFTLIEILLAIGILAIGITAVLSLFMMGARSHQRARDRTRAALLAEAVVNEVSQIHPDPADAAKLVPSCYKPDGDSIWLLDPATGQEVRPENQNPASHADFPEFRYYVAISRLDPASSDYYKVKVIIVWGTGGPDPAGTLDPRSSETYETIVRRKNF